MWKKWRRRKVALKLLPCQNSDRHYKVHAATHNIQLTNTHSKAPWPDFPQFRGIFKPRGYFCVALQHHAIHTRLFTCFILMAFLVQSFSRTWVVADYWLNTGYYAARCENKARPEMHCNGKCQMMKKIRAEERKDAENQERLSEKFDAAPLSSKHFFTEWQLLSWHVTLLPGFVKSLTLHLTGHTHGILRPPIA
jgi:hypothetical protein